MFFAYDRHGPSDAAKLIHILPSPLVQDSSRAEKQGNLHQGVAYHVGQTRSQACGSHKHDPHEDIGQLAYGGVCQSAFQVLGAKGPEGAVEDGSAADAQGRRLYLCPCQKFCPKAPVHHPHQGKHASLRCV